MIVAAISSSALKYLGVAFAIVWGLTVLYVWILAAKVRRLEQQVVEAERTLDSR